MFCFILFYFMQNFFFHLLPSLQNTRKFIYKYIILLLRNKDDHEFRLMENTMILIFSSS
jgi:hypothetical protein